MKTTVQKRRPVPSVCLRITNVEILYHDYCRSYREKGFGGCSPGHQKGRSWKLLWLEENNWLPKQYDITNSEN